MSSFITSDIESWERFYRANFINSLTGFKYVNLIGNVDELGQTNLGIFSSIVIRQSDYASGFTVRFYLL